jgi:hypothetical protein
MAARTEDHINGSQDRGSDAVYYEICLEGVLPAYRAQWFEGMRITTRENQTTILSGQVADQAALHGLLERIRDLGIPLISLQRLNRD